MEETSQGSETEAESLASDMESEMENVGPSVAPIPSQMFSGFDGSLSGPNYAVWIGCAVTTVLVAMLVLVMTSRPPEPATLELVTRPTDATISLDGRPIAGHSPFRLAHLSPDTEHIIEVRKSGFVPQIHHIELATGEVKRLPHVTLQRVPVDNGLALGATPTHGAENQPDSNAALPATNPR